jgi:hypothetical protein
MNERASKISSRWSDEMRNLVSKILLKTNLKSTIYEILKIIVK